MFYLANDNEMISIHPEQFYDGTLRLHLPQMEVRTIIWAYENDAELFTLMCIKGHYNSPFWPIDLYMPYIPHARMDRVEPGSTDVFTLKYFCEAINNMNFVPDEYFIFISDSASAQYELNHANLYINGATMTGEWKMNGVVIPIRMEMNSKVPYIVIYDISTSDPKPILTSYANILSDNTIELINPTGSVFYAVPEDPIILTKTN